MTSNPNSGNDRSGAASSSDFDTVELNRTVPVVPQGTGASSSVGGTGTTSGMGAAGGAGTGQFSASQGGTQGQGTVSQAVDQVQSAAGRVAGQAQETAGQVVDQAKDTIASRVSDQKDRAADSLSTVVQAIRQTSESLRSGEQSGVAVYIDRAADQVERLSTFLRDRDVNDIVYDVERYARRNPAPFLGGAFALGLLAARFLKSSSQSQEEYRPQGQAQYRAPRSYTYSSRPDFETSRRPAGGSYGSSQVGYGGGTGQQGSTYAIPTTGRTGVESGSRESSSFGSQQSSSFGTSGSSQLGSSTGTTAGGTTQGSTFGTTGSTRQSSGSEDR